MDHTAEGGELSVPTLSPKWQEEEWKSIGRILLKGFQDRGYFPCRLAPAFTVALVFGENEVSNDMLFDSLLLYISQSERDLITMASKENLLDEDRDELLDLLDRLDVTTLPTRENLKGLLLKVAHKKKKTKICSRKKSHSLLATLLVLFTPIDGPVLKLPWTYTSYPELHTELDSILNNKALTCSA